VWAGVTTAVTIDETTDETDETTGAIASDFGCEIRATAHDAGCLCRRKIVHNIRRANRSSCVRLDLCGDVPDG
jgi:hypothetical protein